MLHVRVYKVLFSPKITWSYTKETQYESHSFLMSIKELKYAGYKITMVILNLVLWRNDFDISIYLLHCSSLVLFLGKFRKISSMPHLKGFKMCGAQFLMLLSWKFDNENLG